MSALGEIIFNVQDYVYPPEWLTERVSIFVRAGMTPHVAAGMCGVSFATFRRWQNSSAPECRDFQKQILVSKSEARGDAEMRVFLTRPKDWLLKGPERQRKGSEEPGWADTLEVSQEIEQTIQEVPKLDTNRLSIDDKRKLREILRKALPSPDPESATDS